MQKPSRTTREPHPIGKALAATTPWLMLSSIMWLIMYGLEGLALVWVMGTISRQEHAAAKALAIPLVFFLLFLGVAAASAALLLRAGLSFRRIGARSADADLEVAIRRMGHYWGFSAVFWVVAFVGSVFAFFAAGLGAVFL